MRITALISFVAVAIAATALAIACSDGSDSSTARPACVEEAMATATAQPERSTDYRDWLPGDDEGHCRLRKALLSVDVLPGDLGEFARNTSGGAAPCRLIPPSLGYNVGLMAMTEDQESHLSFRQQAVALPDGQAELVMEATRHSCALMAQRPSEDGWDHSYLPLSIGQAGDEAYVILEHVESSTEDLSWDHGHVAVRDGNVVTFIDTFGFDEQGVRELASRSADRLAAAGPIPEPTPRDDECDLRERRRGPDANVLASALLGLEDFPEPGWVELAWRNCAIPEDAYCDGGNALRLPQATASAATAFTHEARSIVDAKVYAFDIGSLDDAVSAYTESDRNNGSCVRNASDGEHRWWFGPLSAPRVGDASWAFFLRWSGPGDSYTGIRSEAAWSIVIVRVGDTVASVSMPAMYDLVGEGDEVPADLVELARHAHEKLVAIQDELD